MAEGLADIGIVASGVDFGDLETLPFRVDRLVVVAPRDHPVAAFRHVAFREILDAEFVVWTSSAPCRNISAAMPRVWGRH